MGDSMAKNLFALRQEMCVSDPLVRKIPWRTKWQPIPAFLPGKVHGQTALVGYSPWSLKSVGQYLVTKTATIDTLNQNPS